MDARKTGSDIPRAIDYSLEKAGSAITVTTIVLALGTFVLIFSGTGLFQNVALLITPIVLVALFLDLLFYHRCYNVSRVGPEKIGWAQILLLYDF